MTYILWKPAQLLVSCISPIYLVGEFICSFYVLLKEMRMLGESKILSCFSGVNQGMRTGEFEISFSKPQGGKLFINHLV